MSVVIDIICPKCGIDGLICHEGNDLRCGYCGTVIEKTVASKDDKLLRAGSLKK
jgi:uncharacterized Zn finger protein